MRKPRLTFDKIYALSILFLMYVTINISFLWNVSFVICYCFCALVSVLLFFRKDNYSINSNKLVAFFFLLFVIFYDFVTSPSLRIIILIVLFCRFICWAGFIFSTDDIKLLLLHYLRKSMGVILAISIPAWILYLCGVNLPHSDPVMLEDGFHYLIDYHFFLTAADPFILFPRFRSMFLEPGWVGTISVFLLFSDKLSLKSWESKLMLVAIILSFSLAAYVLLFVSYLLLSLSNRKRILLKTTLLVAIVGAAVLIGLSFNDGDNYLNKKIIERLTFDEEKGIAGNNRTSYAFSFYWDRFINSNSKYFGLRSSVGEIAGLNNSSGIKKQLLLYGFVGTTLFLFFLISLFSDKKSKEGLIFFFVFLLSAFVRDLWRTDFYVFCFICVLTSLSPKSDSCPVISKKVNNSTKLVHS